MMGGPGAALGGAGSVMGGPGSGGPLRASPAGAAGAALAPSTGGGGGGGGGRPGTASCTHSASAAFREHKPDTPGSVGIPWPAKVSSLHAR